MATGQFLTVRDAAMLCGVNRETVRRWVRQKFVSRFETPTGGIRVNRDELIKLIKLRRDDSPAS